MKELLYTSPYSSLYYTFSLREIEYICYDPNKTLSKDEYYELLEAGTRAMEQVQVRYIIADFRELEVPVTPDIQEKMVLNIVPRWNQMGVKKVAVIMPAEFIARLSVEQIVDDAQGVALYTTRYFDSLDKARTWFYPAT